MFIIRPIKEDDLEGLLEMLDHAGYGLTTLPKDPEVLLRRIKKSQHSFYSKDITRPGGEDYLFIMEEVFTGKIAGISGIISKIGGFDPYYFYRLETEKRFSKLLNKGNEIQTLHVEAEHNGPSEICSLFLSPDYRNSKNGRLLSLSRFLFIKENRQLFEDEIIAEMRGQVDDEGNSPFWKAVGKKFFDIKFTEADYLSMKNKQFIHSLLPKYPIIVNLLPKEAREVVGIVHKKTEPAKHILETEGFSFQGLVGIFEPGPILSAQVDEIRTIKESKVSQVKEISPKQIDSDDYILATVGKIKFKAGLGKIEELADGGLRINEVTATALKLRLGDDIRYVKSK